MSEKDVILIVDDMEINRTSLKIAMGEDYKYCEASNGEEALKILKYGTSVDLILLDLIMPVMNGIEFIKIVKRCKAYCDIPVIVCTVDDNEQMEVNALKLGAEDYLIKPFRPMVVKQRAANILRRQHLHRKVIEEQAINSYVSELQSVYLVIFELNYTKDTYRCLFAGGFEENFIPKEGKLNTLFDVIKNDWIRTDENDKFIEITNSDNIKRNIKSSLTHKIQKEFEIKNKDGYYGWRLATFIESYRKSDDEIYISCVEDITQRKYNEESLQEKKAEEKLANMLKNLPVGVGVFEIGNEIHTKYLNNQVFNLFGESYRADTKIQDTDDKYFVKANRENMTNILFATQDMIVESIDLERRVDGEEFWMQSVSKIICNTNGTITCYTAMIDVTDRELEKQRRVESEKRLKFRDEISKMLLDDRDTLIYDVNFDLEQMEINYRNENGERKIVVIEDTTQIIPFIHPDDRAKVTATYRRSKDYTTKGTCEYRANYYGKDYIWYRITYHSYANDSGHIYRLLGKCENIQSQKELEQRYQQEVVRRSTIESGYIVFVNFNITKNSLIETDIKEPFEFNFCDNMNSEDIIEEISSNIINDQERKVFKTMFSLESLLKAFRDGEKYVKLDCRYQMKNKKICWVRTYGNFVVQPVTGELIVFFYGYDINDKKLTNIMIQNIIRKDYESMFFINTKDNRAKILSISEDYSDYNYNIIQNFNKSTETYLKKYCINADLLGIINAFSIENIQKKLQEKNDYTEYYSIRTKDGEKRRKQSTFAYIDKENQIISETIVDITQIYNLEQDKNKKLKMALETAKKANSAKTDFLSRMSHDIRTPMNAIIGMVELAKDENNIEVMREYFSNINVSSRFLLGLINDILDLNKIESGQFELHPQDYMLEDFTQSLTAVIGQLMDEKGINFIVDVSCKAACIVVDTLRYNQIFFNLLSNAAKFTPVNGTVKFTCEHIGDHDEKYGIRCCVSDTGIGMSEDYMKHMFEPFSQEKSKGTLNIQGTGLGLPIVKSIIDAMGGTIKVNSKIGKGTEYIIELYVPIAKPQKKEISKHQINLKDLEDRHILLVEDNALNVMVAKTILERGGCIVDVAENGQIAVDVFNSSKENFYDAILMDIRMPVMNGLDSTKIIRNQKRIDASNVPIIAMTADAFQEDMKKSSVAGMNAHLSKPINPNILYSTLLEYIAKRQ